MADNTFANANTNTVGENAGWDSQSQFQEAKPMSRDADLYVKQSTAANMGEERNPSAPLTSRPEELLEKQLQDALLDIVDKYELQSDTMRRPHLRRMLEGEEFWKGNHYNIWDERTSRWYTPFENYLQTRRDEYLPRLDYVTNQYLALGWSTIAAITRKPPKARTQPKSASNERDIATSKAADKVCDLIERNNRTEELTEREAYLCWTQGGFGGHVRFVRSTEFGVEEKPNYELQTVQIAPDRYTCPGCAQEQPAAGNGTIPQAGGMTPWSGNCPGCGQQLTDANFAPAEYGQAPVVSSYRKVAEGREVISVYGMLFLKMLPYAMEFKDTPYLFNVTLRHESAIRAAYPLKADKVGMTSTGTAVDDFDRRLQGQLSQAPRPHGSYVTTGTSLQGMVAYKQCWIRNWGLWGHPNKEIREKLLAKFPDGVYVAFAEREFLEARNEDVDKFWRIAIAMPGNGIYRQGVGDSTIHINKRLNDTENIKHEFIEHSAFPTILADGRFISAEGWENRKQEAGSLFLVYPENAGTTVPLQSMLYQPTMRLDGNIYQHGNSLMELGQFVSGAYPSIFGGGMPHNETASGYAQARDAAMGRLQMIRKKMDRFHAEIMQLGVECFRENRTEDAELVVVQKSKDYASEYIHLEDLQGNITVQVETDEDFPASWGEIRDYLIQMAQYAPSVFQSLVTDPANATFVKKFMASPELQVPGEESRLKQMRIIDMLTSPGATATQDPMTGEWIPSIMPDMYIDDHAVCIAANREWAAEKGLDVKQMNSPGFMNVIANTQAHLKQQIQEQQELAALSAPPVQAGQPQAGNKPPQGGPPAGR
jgi:hypothetical protein